MNRYANMAQMPCVNTISFTFAGKLMAGAELFG